MPERFTPYGMFDAAMQRAVDAAAFWLMRRCGWTKRLIRYALWALVITSAGAGMWLRYRSTGEYSAIGLLFIAFTILVQWMDSVADRMAEDSDAVSMADEFTIGPRTGGVKLAFWLVFAAMSALTALVWRRLDMTNKASHAADIVSLLALILTIYLAKTPKEPPPARESRLVLAPQPSKG